MRLSICFILMLLVFMVMPEWGQAQNTEQIVMLKKINKLRSQGCRCGGQKMEPVHALSWSKVLMTSAYRHAVDMNENRYFSHYSPTGKDIGDRLDDVGYAWSYCGENLGSGQRNFDQVMQDWIKSPSHCRMLMSSEVMEVAVAREGKIWVQHFGKKFDPEVIYGSQK